MKAEKEKRVSGEARVAESDGGGGGVGRKMEETWIIFYSAARCRLSFLLRKKEELNLWIWIFFPLFFLAITTSPCFPPSSLFPFGGKFLFVFVNAINSGDAEMRVLCQWASKRGRRSEMIKNKQFSFNFSIQLYSGNETKMLFRLWNLKHSFLAVVDCKL